LNNLREKQGVYREGTISFIDIASDLPV
jgi:hypothetical protein